MKVIKMICVDLPLKDGSCEKVWLRRLSRNTGEIDNIPFLTRDYKYKDVIEFNPLTLDAIKVISDGGYTPTEIIKYTDGFDNAKAEWEAKGYEIEGVMLGVLAVTKRRNNYEDNS